MPLVTMGRSSGGAGVLSSTGDGHCQWLCYMQAQMAMLIRSNTSLHCELAHALCCPLQAIHSVIFVVVDRHWNCGYCSKSRSSYVWPLQRSICTQNTSGLNFCGFYDSSSHPQIFSSIIIWAKMLHNCCKNGRRMRYTLTYSTVVFVACLGTNMHQFSIRLLNTPNAMNNILFYCCLCVASW